MIKARLAGAEKQGAVGPITSHFRMYSTLNPQSRSRKLCAEQVHQYSDELPA